MKELRRQAHEAETTAQQSQIPDPVRKVFAVSVPRPRRVGDGARGPGRGHQTAAPVTCTESPKPGRRLVVLMGIGFMLVSFSLTCKARNSPPERPQAPFGPVSGEINIPYAFSASTFDLEGDSIRYQFDWGDSSAREWSGFLPSGAAPARQSHAWELGGSYSVKVMAQDKRGDTSEWSSEHSVSIIGYPHRLVATIPVGPEPCRLAASPDGKFVYATDLSGGRLCVIRTSDNTLLAAVPDGAGPGCDLAVSPNGEYIYIAGNSTGSVQVIRASDLSVVASIPLGQNLWGIAAPPNGDYVYVSCQSEGQVAVIRTSDNTLLKLISLWSISQPLGLAADVSGKYVYACDQSTNSVWVISARANTVSDNIYVPDPGAAAVTPDGQYVYVSSGLTKGLLVVRPASRTTPDTISTGSTPSGVACLPNGKYVYSSLCSEGKVSIVRTSDNTVAATVPAGKNPSAMVALPGGDRVYVANWESGTVSVLGY